LFTLEPSCWKNADASPSFPSGSNAIAATLPFLLLLALQQKAATGSAMVPTQTEYFLRSDWPPTCHRIGFGKDIGCSIEHPDAPADTTLLPVELVVRASSAR
jgi:hypothetical protein